jgi:hypothetical protein
MPEGRCPAQSCRPRRLKVIGGITQVPAANALIVGTTTNAPSRLEGTVAASGERGSSILQAQELSPRRSVATRLREWVFADRGKSSGKRLCRDQCCRPHDWTVGATPPGSDVIEVRGPAAFTTFAPAPLPALDHFARSGSHEPPEVTTMRSSCERARRSEQVARPKAARGVEHGLRHRPRRPSPTFVAPSPTRLVAACPAHVAVLVRSDRAAPPAAPRGRERGSREPSSARRRVPVATIDDPEPPFRKRANCVKSPDDGETSGASSPSRS